MNFSFAICHSAHFYNRCECTHNGHSFSHFIHQPQRLLHTVTTFFFVAVDCDYFLPFRFATASATFCDASQLRTELLQFRISPYKVQSVAKRRCSRVILIGESRLTVPVCFQLAVGLIRSRIGVRVLGALASHIAERMGECESVSGAIGKWERIWRCFSLPSFCQEVVFSCSKDLKIWISLKKNLINIIDNYKLNWKKKNIYI